MLSNFLNSLETFAENYSNNQKIEDTRKNIKIEDIPFGVKKAFINRILEDKPIMYVEKNISKKDYRNEVIEDLSSYFSITKNETLSLLDYRLIDYIYNEDKELILAENYSVLNVSLGIRRAILKQSLKSPIKDIDTLINDLSIDYGLTTEMINTLLNTKLLDYINLGYKNV